MFFSSSSLYVAKSTFNNKSSKKTKNVDCHYVDKLFTNMFFHLNSKNVNNRKYYITSITKLIIESACDIYLPQSFIEGGIITLINTSGLSIHVNSQNNIKIFNNFYLHPDGETVLQLNDKIKCEFIFVINSLTQVSSWIAII
jgi:hypothetical protein